MMNSQWETVIGLEIHTQLATKSKIFSAAATAYGAEPNTQACAVDLGLPGVLPVLNEEAVNMAIKFGLGVDAEIAPFSVFARKNYFYPDLPKGYQISQMDKPIVGKGHIDIEVDGKTKRINITRAHLEEDAGKSLHEDFHGLTGIDLNRAGTPLLEIVSEPDMRSPKEAIAYARSIHNLVKWLGISDGNMEEGSFRCDVNVSVRPKGQAEFGTRREIKNLNSFRFMQQAIDFEVDWQIEQIESGRAIQQATVLFNPNTGETKAMRSKEEANDYRYFPDPDLLPVLIDESLKTKIKAELPELPVAKKIRFIEQYQLDSDTATILTSSRQLADYYETVVQESACEAKLCANWIVGDLLGALNKAGLEISQSPIEAQRLAGLLKRIADNTISGKIAKQIFETLWESSQTADEVIDAQGLRQITDTGAIAAIIDEIIAANQKQVEQYRGGNEKVFGFFVGQVMKAMQGKANPAEVNKLLKEKLS
jgi:aspartyl-tRNA(Asn)/glutamyl-tRNA(Gln) amidotransferase subunit B